jgi:hypothetical protein
LFIFIKDSEKDYGMGFYKVIVLVSGVFLLALLQGCDFANVEMVKKGHLNNCPSKTMEQMVDGFMGDPKWEGITGTDGNSYVNVSGNITYYGKQVRATYQFKIDGESFSFNALEFNGVPQNMLMSLALLNKMCVGE